MSDKSSPSPGDIRVAVRQLVAFVHQEGGLSHLSFGELGALEGTRVHQAFFRQLRERLGEAVVHSEYSLACRYEDPALCLHIRGRADLVVEHGEGRRVIEVKSVGIPIAELTGKGEPLHWAQCKLYAYMLALEERTRAEGALLPEDEAGRARLRADFARGQRVYSLAYVSSDDLQSFMIERSETFAALEAWFELTCRRYLDFARSLRDYRLRRDRDLAALRFPYPSLREGQKRFMRQVLRNLQSRTPLLVQAPTGTGKTMSTLYPSLKALGAKLVEQVFYLTAKTSTRMVAEEALDALCGEGCALRRLTLTAKEQLCPCPELYCDTRICPYATAYYRDLPEALGELLPHFSIRAAELLAVAAKHKVCPFELALDAALYCDVIIGDYNHAFDPRVRLQRFFDQPQSHLALLVDEAHNLPDRMREMYGASLEEAKLLKAHALVEARFKGEGRLFASLLRYLQTLKRAMAEGEAGFDLLEKDLSAAEIVRDTDFRALRHCPPALLRALRGLVFTLRPLLDEFAEPGERRRVLDFYFEALYFLRVADEFYNERYVFTADLAGGKIRLRQLCLDASDRLIRLYRNQHAAVFFSATLSPLPYFSAAFCGSDVDDRPDSLVLPSPFPAENLMVCVFEAIQTRYSERAQSLASLVKLAVNTVLARPGKYLLFFPSYAYLEQSLPLFERVLKGRDLRLIRQRRNMDEAARREFLAQFDAGAGGSLLALALLGGIFGEGIDLTGERLNGVMIVGTGLPQLSPERELMKAYFDEKNGQGFAFAYQFPGFSKVMQAAGRLIRGEEDKGVILLFDQRYARPDYRQLFPEEWEPIYLKDLAELRECLGQAPDYAQRGPQGETSERR